MTSWTIPNDLKNKKCMICGLSLLCVPLNIQGMWSCRECALSLKNETIKTKNGRQVPTILPEIIERLEKLSDIMVISDKPNDPSRNTYEIPNKSADYALGDYFTWGGKKIID